jgi:hypothetical protein
MQVFVVGADLSAPTIAELVSCSFLIRVYHNHLCYLRSIILMVLSRYNLK